MFDGNVYYCWFCDAHRRGVPGVAGMHYCPRCAKELDESERLTGSGEDERRPIFAINIHNPAEGPLRVSSAA